MTEEHLSIQEITPALSLARGNTMRFYRDYSQPSDSILSRWSEVTHDGAQDSQPFVVLKHWHEFHDEHTEVLEGRVWIYNDKAWTIVTPSHGRVVIPRGVVHGIRTIPGERMVLKEFTAPTGEFKEAFFRDLFATGSPGTIRTFRALYHGDGYPSLGGVSQWLDRLFIKIVGSVANWFDPGQGLNIPEQEKRLKYL